MTIGDICAIVGMWLFITFMAATLWEHNTWTFQETLARTVMWPFVLPILLVMWSVMGLKYSAGVVRYIPDALGDIWRMR